MYRDSRLVYETDPRESEDAPEVTPDTGSETELGFRAVDYLIPSDYWEEL